MEDKKNHIDSFLEEKLGALEAGPDEQAWQAIAGHIEHLVNPIDLSLNNHLSGLGDDSKNDQLSVLNNALEAHPIDISLGEKLDMLEAMPDHTAMAPILASGNSANRRRRAIWWFGGLAMAISAGLLLQQKDWSHQAISQPASNNLAVHANKSKPHSIPPEVLQSEETKSVLKNRIYTTNQTIAKNKGHYVPENLVIDEEVTNEETFDLIRPFPDFGKQYDPDSESIVPHTNSISVISARRLSPFSIHFQAGYLNQTSVSDRQEAMNIHKDATNNFEKASGHAMNGSLYSLQAAWNFKRFSLRLGFQYAHSVSTSHFDYIYNQLPVYDSIGNLTDYITRPNSQSPHINEQVKTKSTSLSVPVQLYVQLGQIGRIGLWGGIGSDLVLSKKVSGRLFSFEDEGMKDYTTKSQLGLSPHISLMGQYRIATTLAITANMQYAYSAQHINFESAKYARQQVIPSLRLGLLYTPTVRIR